MVIGSTIADNNMKGDDDSTLLLHVDSEETTRGDWARDITLSSPILRVDTVGMQGSGKNAICVQLAVPIALMPWSEKPRNLP